MDALTALLQMVKQNCAAKGQPKGTLCHQFISAHEDAFEVLEREGVIRKIPGPHALYEVIDNRGLDW